jgi:acyl-coenzyme A synthetase/AMP-(fatty) acid ligase
MTDLLHELPLHAAERNAAAPALTSNERTLSYADLAHAIERACAGLLGLGIGRGERVAVYLDKRFETVVAMFGAARAGAVFVPVNPILKAEQVVHILRDCNVRVLVTGGERANAIIPALAACPDLRHVVTLDANGDAVVGVHAVGWDELIAMPPGRAHRVIDTDMTSIFYTSGSTGKPKGVML